MRAQRPVHFTRLRCRSAGNQRKIFLLRLILTELSGKMSLSLDVFREDDHATGVFVQSMHDADARIDSAGRGKSDLPANSSRQVICLGTTGNGRKASGFIQDNAIRTFPQHIQFRFRSHMGSVA